MLKLPVPEADYENIVLKPSEHQKEMVQSLAERAEAVRDRKVDATVGNMLKITNDGRKLALDQRLMGEVGNKRVKFPHDCIIASLPYNNYKKFLRTRPFSGKII